MNTSTTTNDSTPTAAVEPRRGVLVITDDSDDPGLAAARAYAAELAARAAVSVILYDRSEETWADTPHPEGPLSLGDDQLQGRTELVRQMLEIREMGAEPLAWIATLPSISAVLTAIIDTKADVVAVSESMDRKILERALVGDSVASALRNQLDRHTEAIDACVLEVAADGSHAERVD